MATLTAVRPATTARKPNIAELVHRVLLGSAMLLFGLLILFLAVHGLPYYSLRPELRPFSPLHQELRSSGHIGLRLAFLSIFMFVILLLYPIRKRWRWLSTIGSTRRWLNFHVLFGIATPIVVTFHTSFKWHGVAGLAYWTMIMVALSGFIGRYVYAKIPRSLNSAALSMGELEAQISSLANRVSEQSVFLAKEMGPLLEVPTPLEIRSMNFFQMLSTVIRLDARRALLIARLRRQALTGAPRFWTVHGLLRSKDSALESVIAVIRRQSRLLAGIAFLDRMQRLFHLWHVVHRPFSISFVLLTLVHIAVVLSVGF